MTEGGYLERLGQREAERQRKAQAVFGVAGGFIVFLWFGFRALYVPEASPWPNWAASAIGGILFLAGLALPSSVNVILSPLQKIGNRVGGMLLSAILAAIYFIVVTPIGALHRVLRGSRPFYRWDTAQPEGDAEGWTEKSVAETEAVEGSQWKWTAPVRLVAFIARRKNYILLPVLVILVVLGMAMFFVHSTGIAPLIYTLF